MGGSGTVGSYTMYVNPYMVVTNMKFTKHFYIEGQRIVSKLGEMGEYQYLLNPKDTLAGGGTIDFDLKGKDLKDAIYANFEALGLDGAVFTAGKSGKVPYGKLKKYYRNQDLVNAGGGNTTQPDSDKEPSNKVENLQFYYHPDHLGSSSYITDVSGEVYQHMEYFPFGETFIEERTDAEYTSYLYNGKELDEETGLYYYGARYYDPRISMWYGVDPLAEKKIWLTPYHYCSNNPIVRVDPDGRDDYYNENGKYIYSDTKTSNKMMLIDSYSFSKISSKYNILDKSKSNLNLIADLEAASSEIQINVNTSDFQQMWNNSNPDAKDGNLKKEQSAMLILDTDKAVISLLHNDDSQNDRRTSHNPKYKGKSNQSRYLDEGKSKLIIGQIHTHPNKASEGFSLSPHEGDQKVANYYKAPMYTIEHGGNIDKLTPTQMIDNYGKMGSFNIAVDALQTKGGRK